MPLEARGRIMLLPTATSWEHTRQAMDRKTDRVVYVLKSLEDWKGALTCYEKRYDSIGSISSWLPVLMDWRNGRFAAGDDGCWIFDGRWIFDVCVVVTEVSTLA